MSLVCRICGDLKPDDNFSLVKVGLKQWRRKVCRVCRGKQVDPDAQQEYHELYQMTVLKQRRQELKKEVIEHYGGCCSCCGEKYVVFLNIDHIGGGGNAHRLQIFGNRNAGGIAFYRWLRRNGFPPGFRVLCWNCNAAVHYLGRCPHQDHEEL